MSHTGKMLPLKNNDVKYSINLYLQSVKILSLLQKTEWLGKVWCLFCGIVSISDFYHINSRKIEKNYLERIWKEVTGF
jgi:hypothetical protein